MNTDIQKKVRALSRSDLLAQARQLVADERRIQAEFLVYLAEIERQQIHLEMAYGSLHDFLVKELGFADASAYRRVQALRLMKDLPETRQAIEEGKISLSTASALQGFLQAERKLEKTYTQEKKRELFQAIQGKSRREADRLFAEVSPAAMMPVEKERAITETKSSLTVVIENYVIDQLEELKGLLAHHQPAPRTNGEVIAILTKLGMETFDPARKIEKKAARAAATDPGSSNSSRPDATNPPVPANEHQPPPAGNRRVNSDPHSRYIPAHIKRAVWKRDGGRCVYTDPISQRKCGSRFAPEYDHVSPVYLGGESTLENLRLVCREHNKHAANQIFGTEFMNRMAKQEK